MPTVVRFRNGTAVLYPERLFDQTGPVGRWTATVAAEVGDKAREEAPARTGALRSSIWTNENRTGPTSRAISVGASAPHARYVLDGTGDYFFFGTGPAGRPKYIPVGKQNPWPPIAKVFAQPLGPGAISGQAQNDFIGRAVQFVSLRHEALRGFNVTQVF